MSSSQSICWSMLSCQNHHPNRFNAKDMWHKSGICPWWTGATLLNTHLSDLSPDFVTLLNFSFLFHFLSFPWSSISWLLSPYHFTLSLFIYITLSHRWPLVGSKTLSLCRHSLFLYLLISASVSVFVSLSFCISVLGELLDIVYSLCVSISQRSVLGSTLISGLQLTIVGL